jgi:hypothetical protein
LLVLFPLPSAQAAEMSQEQFLAALPLAFSFGALRNLRTVTTMADNIEIVLCCFAIRQAKTIIKINESIIHAIREIQDLWRSGVLTDSEFVEISNRIGW